MLDPAKRLEALRAELAKLELEAFVVPKADEFQLEHVPESNDRLAWLTGFDGSAGLAIVGRARASLFVDDRYTEQAKRQVSAPLWEHGPLRGGPSKWLGGLLKQGDAVGYDPRVHSPRSLDWLRELAASREARLVPVERHLVDVIWAERPAPPCSPIERYPDALAGATSSDKRARMAAGLREEAVDALVITDPGNLAWLLNIRGNDVPNTPFSLGYAILGADASLRVFMDPRKWPKELQAELARESAYPTRFEDFTAFESALDDYAGQGVRIDRDSASEWLHDRLAAGRARVSLGADPCTLAKACKTPQELAAIRWAHRQDGAALVRFFHWFDRATADLSRIGEITEWGLVGKVAEYRERAQGYRDLSFRTISAFGPSAALPHYTVTPQISLPLRADNVYLLDSGSQYLEGTTDITRVAAIGKPSHEMCLRYTQVLRGHIALSRAQFPEGVTGNQLDPLARQYLWANGLDFGHGTGHGVGCYLSVHEGPQRISKAPSPEVLRVGMILSNEPGYYKPGAFGIRIENLLAVIELSPQPEGAETRTLGFETLTLCPYERRLILVEELGEDERQWVDAYHAGVLSALSPLLESDDRAWLAKVTAPLERPA